MEKRIRASLILLGAAMIILTLAAALSIFGAATDRQVFDMLRGETETAAELISLNGDEVCASFGKSGERRVTLVDADGSVVYDTAADVTGSHINRPEISSALEKGSAKVKRSSETFGSTLYYYAMRMNDGRILRLAIQSEQIRMLFLSSIFFMLFIAAMLIAVSVMLSRWLTARITEPIKALSIELDDAGATPDTDPEYPELRPIIDKIFLQKKEIKRQLARVQKEKNRIAAIINNMDEGLVILSPELRVIMLNDSACRYLKTPFDRSECGGMLLSEVCFDRVVCDCLINSESKLISQDGRELQIHVKQIDSSESELGRVGLILDVTERAEIDRIKQEFTANVSHELKTPLTSISGYAEMLENGMAREDDVKLFAGRIRRESARMLTLISDIIKLSKLDCSELTDSQDKIELCSICRECVDMLDISAKQSGVSVMFEGESCELIGSAPELTELVYNLIDNAIRYNHVGGRVDVKLIKAAQPYSGALALLTVSDTGIGIPEQHMSRIFERFYRVDKSRSKETGGTGLGLAIVKHVAERHFAKLELESEPGRGTTVKVIFYPMKNKE